MSSLGRLRWKTSEKKLHEIELFANLSIQNYEVKYEVMNYQICRESLDWTLSEEVPFADEVTKAKHLRHPQQCPNTIDPPFYY